MFIGVCTMEMHIPESGSLKTKRHSLKSLKDRVDIDFAFTNKTDFAVDEPIKMEVAVKNAPTLLVKVSFREKDGRALPDMSAKVGFLQRVPDAGERKAVTAVRPEAVAKRGDRTLVYVLDKENRVRETPVTVARQLGDLLEISGAKAGDRVVLSPPEKLRDGAAVALAKK